jgi:hypothetical protein
MRWSHRRIVCNRAYRTVFDKVVCDHEWDSLVLEQLQGWREPLHAFPCCLLSRFKIQTNRGAKHLHVACAQAYPLALAFGLDFWWRVARPRVQHCAFVAPQRHITPLLETPLNGVHCLHYRT